MGRQVGLIKVKGNIGGVSFYKSNGEDLARVANGPSKDKIMNDDSFVRTRENNSEFGGSAMVGKAMRVSFSASLLTMGDSRLSSRLTAMFKEICSKSVLTRGQRPIVLSTNRSLLTNFEFNNKLSFASVFNAPYVVTNNAGRTQGTVTVAAFQPQTFIHAPVGATHFRLGAALGVVSDHQYNTATKHYEASDPTLNTLNGIAYGAVTAINSAAPVNFTLVASLPGTPTMTATANGILTFGIEFFQRIGTIDYLLAQDNCMKVVSVF